MVGKRKSTGLARRNSKLSGFITFVCVVLGQNKVGGMPRTNPELLIRTSGERRVSNFLLWQIAYSEFVFLDIFWPDFGRKQFVGAVYDYQNRERRFGMVSEQINITE